MNFLYFFIDLATNYDEIKDLGLSNMIFDKLPGTNPKRWPLGLDKLLEKLEELPIFSLFHEPLHYHQDFFSLAEQYLDSCTTLINLQTFSKENKHEELENLIKASKIIILIHLLSGHFPNYVKLFFKI